MSQRYIRRTPEQWQSIIDEQSSSGLSQEAFCKNHNISFGTFQTWRKKLKASLDPMPATFVEVPRSDDVQLPLDQGLRVRLELGAGVVLELSKV